MSNLTRQQDEQIIRAAMILDLIDGCAAMLAPDRHPRPVGETRVFITGHQPAAVMIPWVREVEMKLVRNPSGYLLFFGDLRPTSRNAPAPQYFGGTYALAIRNPGYIPARLDVTLPDIVDVQMHEDVPVTVREKVVLWPGMAYRFSTGITMLYGRLKQPDDPRKVIAVKGAIVESDASSQPYTVDASGDWFLWWLQPNEKRDVTIKARLPDSLAPVVTRLVKDMKRGSQLRVDLTLS